MPRGGGHFGGHHHGGGGHHHGGGGHHHGGGGHYHGGGGGHFHRHHYYNRPYRGGVVFTGWWWPGYYGGRRAYFGFGFCWVIFFVIVIAIFLSISLSTVSENGHKGFATHYAPLETRLIDVSQTFCDGIDLRNPSNGIPATAYVLYNKPSLTEEHSYTISESTTVGSNSYQYWNYFLHHGSSMNASICVRSSQAVEFYIIQGSKNFEDWQDGYDNYVKFIIVGTICPQQQTVSLNNVFNDDDYFFAFAAERQATTFDFTMNFRRKEFGVSQQNIEHICKAGGEHSDKCSVSVPYDNERYFLLTTGNTSSSDGNEDGAAVSWSCNSRVWVYMLAFLVPSLFGILVITIVFVACCLRQRKRNSSSYAGLLSDDAAITTATTTATTTMISTAPPLVQSPEDRPPAYAPEPQHGPPPYPATGMPQQGTYPTANYGATEKPTDF